MLFKVLSAKATATSQAFHVVCTTCLSELHVQVESGLATAPPFASAEYFSLGEAFGPHQCAASATQPPRTPRVAFCALLDLEEVLGLSLIPELGHYRV